jgi:hypothetical protein
MIRKLLAVVGAALLLLGTGVQGAAASTGSSRAHFRTPEGAMRYLARAYNRHDTAALKHVTNPEARAGLEHMRLEATNLQLTRCSKGSNGMAYCTFTHDFPPVLQGLLGQSGGYAEMRVAPARRPGWVAKGDVGCG